jgi:predicted PhzF superfamily epimerase YddE/YHI9
VTVPTELVVIDAFTDRPFSGNPAAVCRLDRPASEAWMQDVAAEMHLSETAYVLDRPDGDYDLRWFTPTTEVALCGHATLATAHLVGGGRFHTRSGVLACTVRRDGSIDMDFPADPPVPHAVPDGLFAALGTDGEVHTGVSDLMVVVADADTVRSLAPDLTALAGVDARAVIVTAASDQPGVDCVSRVFAPRVGIPEDPVTGSAHCTLAPFWSDRTGRQELVGAQLSARGGTVHMRVDGDRVIIGGRAVTVSEVRLLSDPDWLH